MAYTKTVWTNDSGQSLNETNLNKIEQGIKDAHTGSVIKAIYEAEADTNAYTDNEKADVATIFTLTGNVNDLLDTGLGVMSGSSLAPQTIATSATKVLPFDTLELEAGTGVDMDLANQKAIATSSGIFKVRFEAFVSYTNTSDVTWTIYKNGVAFGDGLTLTGQGARVFQIVLISTITLTANDYIELYATGSASTDVTIVSSNATLEKTRY